MRWISMIGLLMVLAVCGAVGTYAAALSGHDAEDLQRAKAQFAQANFQGVLDILKPLHQRYPDSVEVNYYIGIAYEGMLEYTDARAYLLDVVAAEPEHGSAHSYLGEIFHAAGQIKLAQQHLELAQQYHGRPAYTAYLLGQIYLQQKQYDKALVELQRSIDLDRSFTQKAEYSKGIIYFERKQAKLAEQSFKLAIAEDPFSDAGVYAKLSLDKMRHGGSARQGALRARIRYSFAYDDNVILNPAQSTLPLFVSQKNDFRHTLAADISYAAHISKAWRVDSAYQVSQSLHQKLSIYNVTSHAVSLAPTYRIGNGEVGIQAVGEYFALDNKSYLRTLGGYAFYSFAYNANNFGKVRFGGKDYKYYDRPLIAAEDRSGTGTFVGYNLLHTFSETAYAAADISYESVNTIGTNWDEQAIKANASISYPLYKKIHAEVLGSYEYHNFRNVNTLLPLVGLKKKRVDNLYNISLALAYVPSKRWHVIAQYTRMDSKSNIKEYTYTRNIYSIGAEYAY